MSAEQVPAPQLAWPVVEWPLPPPPVPTPPPLGFLGDVLAEGAGVAAPVVAVAVATGVVLEAAPSPVLVSVGAVVPEVGPAALALGAVGGGGSALPPEGVVAPLELSPPQAASTADVPSAASVAAR